jgi:nucleotide-binding universal stress UspA family protein
LPDLQQNLERAAWRDVQALLSDTDRSVLHAQPKVVSAISLPQAIIEYARAEAIDLIITGTHGRGAFKQLLLGSVAERVVRTAPCPVLTVRLQERDFVIPESKAVGEPVRATADRRTS